MKKLNKSILGKYTNTFILFIVFIIASIVHPAFLKINNIINILQYISVTGVMALGLTLVLIAGEIDISVASISIFAAVFGGLFIKYNSSLLVIFITLIIGAFLGLINGFIIKYLSIPSFIMTLAMFIIARAGAIGLSGGMIQFPKKLPGYIWVGQGRLLGVPALVIVFLVLSLITFLFLRYSINGKTLYLVGSNAKAAWLSGIKVGQRKIMVFMFSGIFSSVAGIMGCAQIGQIDPQQSMQGYELIAISIAILGGASLRGGEGKIEGTIQAAFIIGILTNIMNLFAISTYAQKIVIGLVLISVVLFDTTLRQKSGKY